MLRELHALKARFKEHDKKEKKKFAGMFDKLSADSEAQAASAAPAPPAPAPASAPVSAAATSAQPSGQDDDDDDDIGEPLSAPQAFEPTDVSLRS